MSLAFGGAALAACGAGGAPPEPSIETGARGLSFSTAGSGSGDDVARDIALDPVTGEAYAAGFVTAANGRRDIFIGRYSHEVALLASRTIDGALGVDDFAWSLALDGHGNIFVAGAIDNDGSAHSGAIWIGKLDAALNLLASTTFFGAASEAEARGIAWDDAAGALFVTGYVRDSGGGHLLWVARYDANLNLQNQTTFNGGGDFSGYTVEVDGAGNVYAGGAGAGGSTLLVRYDRALVVQNSVTGAGSGGAFDLCVDRGNGWVYFTGGSALPSDLIAGKYDLALNPIASASFGRIVSPDPSQSSNDMGFGIACDSTGLVAVGTTDGRMLDTDLLVFELTTSLGFQFGGQLDGGANRNDAGFKVALSADGYLYIAGDVGTAAAESDLWVARARRL